MTTLCILIALLFAIVIYFLLKDSEKPKTYCGKAKLLKRFTDKQGCFLCEFEQDGNIINAVYGDDNPDLKEGDEVEVVWFGLYEKFPHLMSKEVYNACMQEMNNQNHTL